MTDLEPACKHLSNKPTEGYVQARGYHLSRDLCNYCFPDVEDLEETDLVPEELLVGVGPYADRVHRVEGTGEMNWERKRGEEVSSLAWKLRDPDFGWEDLQKAGGDA